MVWSCRGALSMRQHHAAVKKSRNRLQVPALQSGRLRSETSGPTRCERKPLQGAQTGVVRQGVRIMCRRTAGRCREKSPAGAGLSSSKQVLGSINSEHPNSTRHSPERLLLLCRSHARCRPKELTTGEPIVRSRPVARVLTQPVCARARGPRCRPQPRRGPWRQTGAVAVKHRLDDVAYDRLHCQE